MTLWNKVSLLKYTQNILHIFSLTILKWEPGGGTGGNPGPHIGGTTGALPIALCFCALDWCGVEDLSLSSVEVSFPYNVVSIRTYSFKHKSYCAKEMQTKQLTYVGHLLWISISLCSFCKKVAQILLLLVTVVIKAYNTSALLVVDRGNGSRVQVSIFRPICITAIPDFPLENTIKEFLRV